MWLGPSGWSAERALRRCRRRAVAGRARRSHTWIPGWGRRSSDVVSTGRDAFHARRAVCDLGRHPAALGITREDFRERGARPWWWARSGPASLGAIGSGIITSATKRRKRRQETRGPARRRGRGRTLSVTADPGGELNSTPARSRHSGAGHPDGQPLLGPRQRLIDGGGVDEKGKTVGPGGTSTVRTELRPGEYAFYCSVAGHREGGMEGALTVK